MLRLVTLLMAALLVTAGCGTSAPAGPATPAGPAAPAPEADPARWTDRVCDATAPFFTLIENESGNVDQSDPGTAVPATVDRSERARVALDETLAALGAVGPSPVPDGDAFATALTTFLTDLRAAFTEINESVRAIDPAAPDAEEKLEAATAPIDDVSDAELRKVSEGSEVGTLLDESPRCADLASVTG